MFGHWRRSPWFGVQLPLYDQSGDGGGGGGDLAGADADAHPDYDPDFGDGAGDDPPEDPSQSSARPGAPVRQPAQGDDPGAGQDPRTPPITAEQYDTVVTGYRNLQQTTLQLQAQNRILQQQIAALTGVQPPQGPAGGQPPQNLSEADQKALTAIYRIIPGLKALVEKAPELLGLPETVNGFKSEAENRWTDLGTRMWDAFDKSVAEMYGGQQLHAFAQKSLDAAFLTWLETDKNAAARYRMGDTTLAGEFVKMYRTGVVGPAHRGNQPPRGAQPGSRPGSQPPRVPRGGPGQPAAGQRPAQPNVKKPDELHEAAADAYFAGRA